MTKRRTPKQARARKKVEAILEAAHRLLEDEGPGAFNTNRVAKEAGIGVGSLYEYFPNKTAIAQRLLQRLDEIESAEILNAFQALEDASLAATIEGIVETAFGLYQRHSHLYQSLRVVAGDLRRREGIRPVEEAILQTVKQRLQQHKDELQRPDLDFAALMIFYTVEALAFASSTHAPQHKTDRDWIDETVAMIRGYLGY